MATVPRPRTPIDETLWRDSSFYRVHGLTQNMGTVAPSLPLLALHD